MAEKSGFDMQETVAWYKQAVDSLVKLIPGPRPGSFPYPIEEKHLVQLSEQELLGLWHLFPPDARERSDLRKVVGQEPTFFHKNSLTQPKPSITTNVNEAISPTAIVPSYVTGWPSREDPRDDIWLYSICEYVGPAAVRRIILSQAFIHEIVHTLINPALYLEGYTLTLDRGKVMSGEEFILGRFGPLAENHAPISHYASAYRQPNRKYDTDRYGEKTPVAEELCECVAAFLLGFVFCDDVSRRLNPFVDRPKIKKLVQNFLLARHN